MDPKQYLKHNLITFAIVGVLSISIIVLLRATPGQPVKYILVGTAISLGIILLAHGLYRFHKGYTQTHKLVNEIGQYKDLKRDSQASKAELLAFAESMKKRNDGKKV